MKRQWQSWFASAAMLCAAAALFAYNPTVPVVADANTGSKSATLVAVPMPARLAHTVLKVVPADSQNAVGEKVTVAQLRQVLASSSNPRLFDGLAHKFKTNGWAWTEQTPIRVTTAWYRIGDEPVSVGPANWNWQEVVNKSTTLCGCCDSSCSSEMPGGDPFCCTCCIIE